MKKNVRYLAAFMALLLLGSMLSGCKKEGAQTSGWPESASQNLGSWKQSSRKELETLLDMSLPLLQGAEHVSYSYLEQTEYAPLIGRISYVLDSIPFEHRLCRAQEFTEIAGGYKGAQHEKQDMEADIPYILRYDEGGEGTLEWLDQGVMHCLHMSEGAGEEKLFAYGPGREPETTAAPVLTDAVTEFPQYIDLDGDGQKEMLELTGADPGKPEAGMGLVVTRGENRWTGNTGIQDYAQLWLTDLDGDGVSELLLEGNCGDESYCIWAWRFTGEGLKPLSFASPYPENGTAEYFYGWVAACQKGGVRLNTRVDMLGTYGAECWFHLEEDTLIPDEERWAIQSDWEYALTTKMDLYVYADENEDGDEAAETLLPKGTRCIITGTDFRSRLWFETEKGVKGAFAITLDEDGLLIAVCGEREEDCMEGMQYAG